MADTSIDLAELSDDEILELVSLGMALLQITCDFSVFTTDKGKVVVELEQKDATGLRQSFPADFIGDAILQAANEGYFGEPE